MFWIHFWIVVITKRRMRCLHRFYGARMSASLRRGCSDVTMDGCLRGNSRFFSTKSRSTWMGEHTDVKPDYQHTWHTTLQGGPHDFNAIFHWLEIKGHYFQSDLLQQHGATWIQEHHHCWKQIPSIVIEGHIIVKKKSDRGHTMLKSDHYFYWIFSILHS